MSVSIKIQYLSFWKVPLNPIFLLYFRLAEYFLSILLLTVIFPGRFHNCQYVIELQVYLLFAFDKTFGEAYAFANALDSNGIKVIKFIVTLCETVNIDQIFFN